MNYDIGESLKRCSKFIFEDKGFDEFIKRIDEAINENYTKEQCYEDMLKCADFGFLNVISFIKHIILSENQEDIDIIIEKMKYIREITMEEIVSELQKDEKTREFLKQEIKNGLIAKQSPSNNMIFLKFLLDEEDGKTIAIDRFEDFFVNGYDYEVLKVLMDRAGLPQEKVLDNKEKVLKNSYGKNIILFIKWFNQNGKFNDEDVQLEDFIKALYSDIKDETSVKMLEIFYKEIMDRQDIAIKDIDILREGQFNTPYKIGQFILKIGDTRETKTIPYHRRILQPLVRQNTNPNGENNFYIEIQNVVDADWYKGMTEEQIQEELYKIYKEMRRDGVVWTDIKKENIGRLIKPNRTNYYTETLEGNIDDKKTLRIVTKELEVSDDAVGIVGRKQEECLQPGELVILDSDFVYKAEDINFENEMRQLPPAIYIRYEQRYRYELAQEKEER